jgi:hypothetical protein
VNLVGTLNENIRLVIEQIAAVRGTLLYIHICLLFRNFAVRKQYPNRSNVVMKAKFRVTRSENG